MAGRRNEDEARAAERRTMVLMALMALWLAAYGYSIIHLITTAPIGSGFTRGLNRFTGFLGWQGVAGMLAFGCWGIGWSFPKGSGIRRASAVPLVLALALVLVIIGMVIFGVSA